MIPVETDSVPEVFIDWPAYYEDFCHEHHDPVEYGGRLLFEDGWTYSAFDYAGPEWPPPEDEGKLKGLKIRYWSLRKKIVVAEVQSLQTRLRAVDGLQSGKSLPLPLKYDDSEQRGIAGVVDWKDLDITAHHERLGALRQDVKDCDNHLRELGVRDDKY